MLRFGSGHVWVVAFVLSSGAMASAGSAEEPRLSASMPASVDVRPLDVHWSDARACWQRIVRIDQSGASDIVVGRQTVERFLESAHARELLDDLCSVFVDKATGHPTSLITVRFVDQLPIGLDLAEGSFQPATRGAEAYEVQVQIQRDRDDAGTTVFVFGQYPDNPDCAYTFYYQHAVSSMAQVLYHELLHIWFINTHFGATCRYPTGHGLVTRCQFEEEFLDLLAENAAELSTIEGHPPLNFGSNRPRSSNAAR